MGKSKSKKLPKWIQNLIPIPFLIAGIALLIFGSESFLHSISSTSWPKTDGLISESTVVEKLRAKGGRKRHYPEISYSYTVDDEVLWGDRVIFGTTSYSTILKDSKARSTEWVAKYPKNSTVAVAYNPDDPSLCVLEPGFQFSACFKPLMGLGFVLVGILIVRDNLRKKRKRKHPADNTP